MLCVLRVCVDHIVFNIFLSFMIYQQSNVYRYVIDDVINQVRGDFEDMGIDEAVLQELQRVSGHVKYVGWMLILSKISVLGNQGSSISCGKLWRGR